MKIYLENLSRLCDNSGDLQRLGRILVALTLNSRRLNNSLEEGTANILRWTFSLTRRRNTTTTTRQLVRAFMAELNRRLELSEVYPDTVYELGIFISTELLQKKGWDQGVTTEEDYSS